MNRYFFQIPTSNALLLLVAILGTWPPLLSAQAERGEAVGRLNESVTAQVSTLPASVPALLVSASDYIQQNDYEQAFRVLTRAYELAEQHKETDEIRDVLNAMANAYYNTAQYEQAQRYYEQLQVLDEGDWQALSVTLYNLGHVSASQQNYTKAGQEFSRSLLLSRELGDLSGQAFALKALGVNAQAQGNPVLARQTLDQSLELFEALNDDIQVAHVNRHLGDVTLMTDDYSGAIEYYLQALPVYLYGEINSGLMRTYRGLSIAYESLGDYDKALTTYKAFNSLLQDQLEHQGSEATRRLQVAFETQRYADENSELSSLNRSQQEELDYRQSLLRKQYVINGLSVGVLVLIGLMFFRSQQFAREMKSLATTDDLTGLLNRRAIIEHGVSELQRAERFDRPFSCLMFDIDHFKSINDTYGHEVGDSVLKKVAAVVKASLRQSDSLGRIGGEEFLLIAPETEPEKAEVLAERIRNNVAAARFEEMEGRTVTVSIGVAQLINEQSLEELIRHADKALYSAKSDGRNQVVVFQA